MGRESKDGNGSPLTVVVDYDRLPIRCRACQSLKNRMQDCKDMQRKPMQGIRQQPYTFHANHQAKGKHIDLDDNGFPQVRNRKNIRRNIFNRKDDNARKNATDLGTRAQADWNQSQQIPARTSHIADKDVNIIEAKFNKADGRTTKTDKHEA